MKSKKNIISNSEVHPLILSIAKELKRVCDLLGISFFLMYGTLLGAVRHGGFIPWDDDFDVGMLSHDYEILLSEFNKIADKRYRLIHYTNTEKYIWPYAKIIDTCTSMYEKTLKPPFDYGLFVDIFPFYRVDIKKEKTDDFRKRLLSFYRINMISDFQFAPGIWKIANLWNLLLYTKEGSLEGNGFKYLKTSPCEINKKLFDFIAKYISNGGRSYFSGFLDLANDFRLYKANYFEDFVTMKFEDTEFLVPKCFDEILTNDFGDYMIPPPEKARKGGHIENAEWK